jgi:hypothetical protein
MPTALPERAGYAPAASFALALLAATALGACAKGMEPGNANGTTSEQHLSFPIAPAATHALGKMTAGAAIGCESCHTPSAPSFKEFNCLGCHEHEQTVTDRLHLGQVDYTYTSDGCLKCHPASDKKMFGHKGITDGCAQCHDMGAVFAALPVAGFTHPATGGADCGGCHTTATWKGATGGPTMNTHDPAHDKVVNALIPTYAGITIASLAPRAETLPMTMNHGSKDVAAAALAACGNCHPGGGMNGMVGKGTLHASLATLMLPQPTACGSCHADAVPVGFVGPTATAPARVPPSGEMKHDAVTWANGAATATKLVVADCGVCHAAADGKTGGWTTNAAGSGPATYHPALTAAKAAQPSSCIDCHANNLPADLTTTTTMTSASAASGVAAGTLDQLSHADANVTARDCNFCHKQAGPSTAAPGQEWKQARFHTSFSPAAGPNALDTSRGRCSNCHMNVRPGPGATVQDHTAFTSAAGSQDCSTCHAFPGTGTPAAPNWLGAGNVPPQIIVGGFAVPQPPAKSATTQAGIAGLPHPVAGAGATCTTCHGQAGGGKKAVGYDHLSPLQSKSCNACHEAGSDLVGTPWNGATKAAAGAGDTRPFTIVGLVPSTGGGRALVNDFAHFYPVDCHECHAVPKGTGAVTTGAAYTAAWKFNHRENNMTRPSTCNMCHGAPNNIPD